MTEEIKAGDTAPEFILTDNRKNEHKLSDYKGKKVLLYVPLVMTEANFPSEAQGVFRNMENNSNPWGVGSHQRGEWAKDLGIKTCADGEPFDLLLYPGCAGAFDDRYKKVAAAVARILQKAGVNFAILGS